MFKMKIADFVASDMVQNITSIFIISLFKTCVHCSFILANFLSKIKNSYYLRNNQQSVTTIRLDCP